MSGRNWVGVLVLLPLAVLVPTLFVGPVGGCGSPTQVGPVPLSNQQQIVVGDDAGGDAGGSTTALSFDPLSLPFCIVDVNCVPPPSNRVEVFLSGDPTSNPDAAGWRFYKGDVIGAQAPSFDDSADPADASDAGSAWTSVDVPYTWNQIDGQEGLPPPPQTPVYYRGIGWFRKHYTIPGSMTGKRIYLQIDEAEYTTNVYVNGTLVGTHRGGYAAFRFDITSVAKVGTDNVIAIQVDNSQAVTPSNLWVGGTNGNVAPISGDFTFFGGIERDVRVLATDNLAITPLDFGGPGVQLTASNAGGAWTFTATIGLLNTGTTDAMASVEVDIVDEMNAIFQAFTGLQVVPASTAGDAGAIAGGTASAVVTGQVTNPHLWNGRKDPYVYHVNVIVRNGTTVTDAIVQPFGFRTYALDWNNGFSLNGQSLPLHGVATHQDHHDRGGQFSFKDDQYLALVDNDHQLLAEIGANFVRHAHYEHNDFDYSLDDYQGIAAWAENAFVDRIPDQCDTAADCTDFMNNTEQQITELIHQLYNHPSIFFWSLGNEVVLNAGPDPLFVIQALSTLAQAQDRTRTVVYAANAFSDSNPVDWASQATFFNEYFGWYEEGVEALGPWADGLHTTLQADAGPGRVNTPIGLSEYGAGAEPQWHDLPVEETDNNRTGSVQTEEYQAFFHEEYWAQIAMRPFLTITAVWNMFDFASDYRQEGGQFGENTKGLITYDRSVKKDAFYFYKANWQQPSIVSTPQPVVYITSRRFTNLPSKSQTIKVYSNQPSSSLALTLNGTALPAPTPVTYPSVTSLTIPNAYQWTGVTWAPGPNVVQVTAANCTSTAALACSDQVTWQN